MLTAGIDGGGTHTRLEIRDGTGAALRREMLGPFNISAIGEEKFAERIREICRCCGDMANYSALCFGGAGISGSRMETVIRRETGNAGFRGKLLICGDHEIALAGAVAGPGCILISGTGSICYGKNASGQTMRSGGWGHLIDDPGSGYALGAETLSAAVRMCDGRLPPSKLLDAVLARIGGRSAADIVSFTYHSGARKAEIAEFCWDTVSCAREGDPAALDILSRGAEELGCMAQAVVRGLGMEQPPIALMGGMLDTPNLFRDMTVRALEGLGKVTEPAHSALWGAAELAYRAGVE